MRALFLLFLLIASVAFAVEVMPQADGSVLLTVSPEEVAACNSGGGCALVTQQQLIGVIAQACGSKI